MLRALFAVSLIGTYTVLLGIPAVLAALVDRRGGTSHRIVAAWARLTLATAGVRLSVGGLERLPPGPAIFAANHASAADVPILYAGLPVEFRFVHKRSLFLVPIVGQILLLGGHIGIDRGRAFRARRSLAAAARRIRGGTSVLVFPEGTRSRDGRIRTFKRGSFLLAIDAGVPVVPVSLSGVHGVMPNGVLSLRPGRVHIQVHAPLATAGLASADADALSDRVQRVVEEGACGAPG